MTILTITLPKKEKERLHHLALRYGLSLEKFSRCILEEIISDIPEESFEDYENPKEFKSSFARAFRDWHKGRVFTRL